MLIMTDIEQKIVMLSILTEFVKFCENNNISYFLDAGTLIGAVRHKGFIPWDDDIDVNMPRKDYDQFCKLMKDKNYMLNSNIHVEMPFMTLYPFLKISDKRTVLIEFPDRFPMQCEVYIDVFPKDAIRRKNIYSRLLCKTNELLRLFQWFNKFSIYAWKKENNLVLRIIAWLGRKIIINPNIPVKIQSKLIKWHNIRNKEKNCKYVTTLVNGEYNKLAPVECFSDFIMMEFESNQFRVPIDYDTYLKCLYKDDYMELPPIEKREKHNTLIYWKSEKARNEVIRSYDIGETI